ncbi:MAG: hypothetical protein NTV30_09930 [Chloroflexi bacterium]|nr:hypothetical protein [Chloroflexota bacterium]
MYQKLIKKFKRLHKSQLGITGLETAIILIAFVTVASVLAYSVLSAGVFSAERGKETIYSGLKSAQSTLEPKGSLVGTGGKTQAAGVACTMTNAGDLVLDVAHGLSNDTIVMFSGGAIAAPLNTYRQYYVINKTDDNFQVSLTSGGAAVVLTADGNGSYHTLSSTLSYLYSAQFTVGLAVQGETVDMDTMVINYFDVANHNENPFWSYTLSSQSTERGNANLLEGDEQIIVTVILPVYNAVQVYDWFVLQLIPGGGSTMTVKRTMPGSIEAVMNLN